MFPYFFIGLSSVCMCLFLFVTIALGATLFSLIQNGRLDNSERHGCTYPEWGRFLRGTVLQGKSVPE